MSIEVANWRGLAWLGSTWFAFENAAHEKQNAAISRLWQFHYQLRLPLDSSASPTHQPIVVHLGLDGRTDNNVVDDNRQSV